MGKLPDIILRAGWDRSLHQGMVLKGHLSWPVCIWLAFGMCIPRTLWVGKVGLKDGLEAAFQCYKP